ncbi:MAG: erythromycin esterase family protein [Deltaproteobacteria bacterium]|nr:erythromycin esterase family protein [Deltaproteobacteria bacterium]
MSRISALLVLSLCACDNQNQPVAGPTDASVPEAQVVVDSSSAADAAREPFAQCPAPPLLADGVTLQANVLSWDAQAIGDSDCPLLALDRLVASARLICSGENSHGVLEAKQLHAALARYLVLKHNVRVIAVEYGLARMDAWQRALEADDERLLVGHMKRHSELPFWRAVAGLRRAGAPTLRFAGFDIAVTLTDAIDNTLSFLQRVDAEYGKQIEPDLRGALIKANQAAQQIKSRINERRASYVTTVGDAVVDRQLWNLDNLIAAFSFYTRMDTNDFWAANAEFREPALYSNTQRILATLKPGEKMLMVTHNLHCSKNLALGTNADGQSVDAVGTTLSKTLGQSYAAIGQLYGGGNESQGLTASAYPEWPNTLEVELMRNTTAPLLLLPIRGKPFGVDLERSWWTIYGWAQEAHQMSALYDAIGWVRQVTPDHDL